MTGPARNSQFCFPLTSMFPSASLRKTIGTFRSEDQGDYEYEFSVLSMRIRFGGRNFLKCACSEQKTRTVVVLAPVVQRLDNAIHRINHYPADSVVCFAYTYPLDSDLSGG